MQLQEPGPVSAVALFRYAVVSEVRVRIARGQTLVAAVRDAAGMVHLGPDGNPRLVGKRSIYRWLAAYEAEGLAGLENRPRTQGTDGVLEPALVRFMLDEKEDDPRASVPELLRRAVVAGLLRNTDDVDRTTAWRTLRRRGVATRRHRKHADKDKRRFAYPHRLQLILCDGKEFRAGPTRAKRVALFFIDDASRYIPVVVVGTSETSVLFLRGLHELLLAVGRIDAIYLDNGSGFIANDTRSVIAQLQFAHILGLEGYPEGRGKIERFNKTVEEDLLRHLDRPDVDPDCRALELRIGHYLRTDYNLRRHASLKKHSPQSRFLADARPLKPYEDPDALRRHFFADVQRTVTNDHTVSIGSRDWEVPRGLSNERITIRRSVFDPMHLVFHHEGRALRLAEVDLAANARARRGRDAAMEPTLEPPPKGAALTAADNALRPITQPDGLRRPRR